VNESAQIGSRTLNSGFEVGDGIDIDLAALKKFCAAQQIFLHFAFDRLHSRNSQFAEVTMPFLSTAARKNLKRLDGHVRG
jgi:hypothetical protein